MSMKKCKDRVPQHHHHQQQAAAAAATATTATTTHTQKENVHIVTQISDLVGRLFEGAVVCPADARVPDDLTLSWMSSLSRATSSSSSSSSSSLSFDTNEAGTNRGRLVPPPTAEWKRLRVRPGVGCLIRWAGVAGVETAGAAVVVVVVVEVEELEGTNLENIYLDIILCFFREITIFLFLLVPCREE